MPADQGVKRGCGDERTPGGLYLEVGVDDFGPPFDGFILDPTIPLSQDQLNSIPRVGVTLVEDRRGVVHVIDWVGKDGYPYAPDFIEEGRAYGFSRKISPNVDIERLTPGRSMIHFVHPRGHLHNWPAFQLAQIDGMLDEYCIRRKRALDVDEAGLPSHFGPDVQEGCVRHLWAAADSMDQGDTDLRTVGDVTYPVFPPPPPPITPAYVPAFIGSWPITNFTVISAPDGQHRETLKRARHAAKFPVLEGDQ